MNWYIGQEIVAIETHKDGYFKEGEIFTILGLRTSKCKCRKIHIDIGSALYCMTSICSMCGFIDDLSDVRWHGEESFKPLDELCNISELTDQLKYEEPFKVQAI